MTFASFEFFPFFAAVLAGLAAFRSRTSRQLFLLVASGVFYAAGTPWHLAVLAIPAVVDYAVALRIESETRESARRRWLVVSLVSNLGLLGYFKYADFFVDTIAGLFGVATAPLALALPIGISFFTFKTLSYTIDVYRREIPASRSPWRYALFVSFFPELVAGPIVRASIFLPQLDRPLTPSAQRVWTGLQIMALGFSKKLLVANRLAIFVDPVFAAPELYTADTLAAAVVAYSLQIYCDFSGYSDIAIGVAHIIGFDLPENFDMPYASRSITEFWRRWHITLSRWLRDYLYIPLGGNRRGDGRTYVNLMITMLLGGLWHGASWNFVIWGGLHAIALALHKRFAQTQSLVRGGAIGSGVAWLTTYAFVCFCWIFFRAESFGDAMTIVSRIVSWETQGIRWFFLPLWQLSLIVGAAHVIGLVAERRGGSWSTAPTPISGRYVLAPAPGLRAGFALAAILLILFLFAPMRATPFIYFQF